MTEAEIREIFARPKKRTRAVTGRRSLSPKQRAYVLAKTAGTCHVRGGRVGRGWQADHVIPHQHGGAHSLDNEHRYQPTLQLRAGSGSEVWLL